MQNEFVVKIRKSVIYTFIGLILIAGIGWGAYRLIKRQRPVLQTIYTREPAHQGRLLRGFYEIKEAWRYTNRVFAVSLDPTRMERPVYLELDFAVPADLARDHPVVRLTARVNGIEIGSQVYVHDGRYIFQRHVPLNALTRRPAVVEFETDQVYTSTENNRLESLIVVEVAFKEYEQTSEYKEFRNQLARKGNAEAAEEIRTKLSPAKITEFMKLFHVMPVWDHLWFQGVQIIKNPLDLWMMQQIIYEQQPDYIIETGTMEGGSALYWAHTLNGMRLEQSRVITIDITDATHSASTSPLWKKYVQFMHGSSTDPAIVSAIGRLVKNKRVIVTLDSDHAKDHVLKELQSYAPMINKGSYLVVEDTHMDGVPTMPTTGPGPNAAVEQFLKDGGDQMFERDRTRENLIMTFNPGGWLRRK